MVFSDDYPQVHYIIFQHSTAISKPTTAWLLELHFFLNASFLIYWFWILSTVLLTTQYHKILLQSSIIFCYYHSKDSSTNLSPHYFPIFNHMGRLKKIITGPSGTPVVTCLLFSNKSLIQSFLWILSPIIDILNDSSSFLWQFMKHLWKFMNFWWWTL